MHFLYFILVAAAVAVPVNYVLELIECDTFRARQKRLLAATGHLLASLVHRVRFHFARRWSPQVKARVAMAREAHRAMQCVDVAPQTWTQRKLYLAGWHLMGVEEDHSLRSRWL